MTKNVNIVIGANFGDEGKGLITDYLSFQSTNGIVIRFNGGAQAGHTVVTPDGKRHVHSHIGAGAFSGLPTYLSRHFIVNPILFLEEYSKLKKMGITPVTLIDKSAKVTTPYEMMLNQIAEISRGNNRHGSCGLGINETIVRNNYGKDYELYARDLFDTDEIRRKLKLIKEEYVPRRLKELKIEDLPDEFVLPLKNDIIIDNFIYDIEEFLGFVEVADANLLVKYDDYIFEGAQGLMLDENYLYFPYVTHSRTGIFNALELLQEINEIDKNVEKNVGIFYLTRAYLTRHGAGPLFMELDEKPYPHIVDETNYQNEFQGSLRFAHLDIDRLKNTIHDDLKHAEGLEYTVSLGITCLDQVDNEVYYVENGKTLSIEKENYPSLLINHVGFKKGLLSFSPTRELIKKVGI